MPFRSQLQVALVAFSALAAGCTATTSGPLNTFITPQAGRNHCIDAAARRYNVPRERITVTGDGMPSDGFYVVNLDLGPGQPAAKCSVDENGAVQGIVHAR